VRAAKLSLGAAVAALALTAPAADARVYTLKTAIPGSIATAARESKIPVRLPRTLRLDYDKGIYGAGGGSSREFSISISATRKCGGNACFLGSITGTKGGEPAFRRTVRLRRGITGYFKPLSCGASCSPPQIQWIQGGVLYDIQAKVLGGRRQMIRAANQAIAAKPL
jgi:hypothetical protein